MLNNQWTDGKFNVLLRFVEYARLAGSYTNVIYSMLTTLAA